MPATISFLRLTEHVPQDNEVARILYISDYQNFYDDANANVLRYDFAVYICLKSIEDEMI